MRISHFAVYVKDIEAAKRFFETYFGGVAGDMYVNSLTGFRSYFMSFDDGARLEIMSRPELADNSGNHCRVGYAHLAFNVGGRDAVDVLTARLRSDGYETVSGPRITGDGYYESCVRGPEGVAVEITE